MVFQRNARQIVLQMLPKGSVGAEIGVFKGDFSAKILEVANPKKLYLIDPWQLNESPKHKNARYGPKKSSVDHQDSLHQSILDKFSDNIASNQVVVIRKYSQDAAQDIADLSLDFVYIDGDHAYDGVKQDIESYYPKVKHGGLLIGDDYFSGGWWGRGVIDAFNEVINDQKMEIIFKYQHQLILRKNAL